MKKGINIVLKYSFLFIVSIIIYSCNIKSDDVKNGSILQDTTGTKKETNNNKEENNFIEDTMILNGRLSLKKTPDSQGEKIITLEKCTVFVVDKTLLPNKTYLGKGSDDFFIKVKVSSGAIGYLYAKYLITKFQLKAHNDSLAMWSKLPMPVYKDLIGTKYWKNSELPIELGSGAFISIGPEENYGLISVYNKYSDNYSYLFFVEGKGHNEYGDMGLLILDIIPLDWRTFDKNASLWFQQCKCVDTTQECSDVAAVYAHNEEMALKEIKVTPQKAWRPDYTGGKLAEIPVKTVRCGSMVPEEPGEY